MQVFASCSPHLNNWCCVWLKTDQKEIKVSCLLRLFGSSVITDQHWSLLLLTVWNQHDKDDYSHAFWVWNFNIHVVAKLIKYWPQYGIISLREKKSDAVKCPWLSYLLWVLSGVPLCSPLTGRQAGRRAGVCTQQIRFLCSEAWYTDNENS